jgi:uncharacterized membrane protein
MALMAIDHARIICAPQRFAWIADLDRAGAGWVVTHLLPNVCTPGFVGLAGLSAGLYAGRAGWARARRFLWTRGLWLILLELTVVQLGWHSFDWRPVYALQVIWCLGLAMLALAALGGLSRAVLVAAGLTAIALPTVAPGLGAALPAPLAATLFSPAYLHRGELLQVAVTYPALPWIGLMALGFAAAGPLAAATPGRRRGALLTAAGAALLLGLGMRLAGLGDPDPWAQSSRGALFTALDLLSLTKHPGSPAFLLIYGAPVLAAMGLATGRAGPVARALGALGRAPLFFYVAHLFLLQLLAWLSLGLPWPDAAGGWWMRGSRHWPDGFTPALWRAWAGWALCLLLLWPASAGWARRKAASKAWWMRYL